MARTSKAAGKAAGKRPVGGELERVTKATVDLIEKFGPLQIPHLFGITYDVTSMAWYFSEDATKHNRSYVCQVIRRRCLMSDSALGWSDYQLCDALSHIPPSLLDVDIQRLPAGPVAAWLATVFNQEMDCLEMAMYSARNAELHVGVPQVDVVAVERLVEHTVNRVCAARRKTVNSALLTMFRTIVVDGDNAGERE